MPQGSAMAYSAGKYRPGYTKGYTPKMVTGAKGDGARSSSDPAKG